MFSDSYKTTIGTNVSKKELTIYRPFEGLTVQVDATVWDIMGEKGFRHLLKETYFHGANGIIAVADATRKSTLDDLDDWVDSVLKVVGPLPCLIAINKSDLEDEFAYEADLVTQIAKAFDSDYIYTSAKTGENVEEAFLRLGTRMVENQLGL